MLLPLRTSCLRSAIVIRHGALLALTCAACTDDVSCVDLANCTYPAADAGDSSPSAAESDSSGAFSTSNPAHTSASPAISASAAESAIGTPGSEPPSSSATSGAPETSSNPNSPDTNTEDTASDTDPSGCFEANTCECAEGDQQTCWETPEGTPITDDPEDAIGDCKLGKRTCEEGVWSPCLGAIAPVEEDACDRPLADGNCNGEPNEGCDCTPSETRSCGTDEGPCTAGIQTCGADGQWESECVGEVPPAGAETCATEGADANCNGEENEGCECIGTEVEPCNDCGERTCNPQTGRWGACQPVEEPRCSADSTGIQVCNTQGNWQTQTCANADETHCDVSCTISGGSPSCAVSAKDADDDGYRAAACAAAPGDDCDDSTDAVSPGTAEVCDGVDNDCDGKLDLSDGLSLVGSIKDIANRNRVAVASQGSGFFALVGTSPVDQGLFYGSINASGTSDFDTTPIFSPADETYLAPQAAALGATVGVVYVRSGKGGRFVHAGMTTNGCCWEVASPPGSSAQPRMGDISAREQGDFLMTSARTSSSGDTVYVATHNELGSSSENSMVFTASSLDATYSPRVASVGENSGLLWQTLSPRALNWSLLSPSLEFGATEELSATAYYADLASVDTGYAIAWVEGAGFRFMLKDSNGTTACTSSVVPFGTVAANQELALADSAHGVVVIATSPDSNTVHLFRFSDACEVTDDTDVSSSATAPTAPSAARSGTNLVIYWTEGSTGHYRFVSDSLCH